MKTIYEAANAIEAHMLKDYLQQEGVASLVVGEYLQGAIGDLPAGGCVRLLADDSDYARARAAIERWEASVAEPAADQPQRAKGNTSNFLAAALIGLAVGAGGAHMFYRAPATQDGVDYNRDGVPDERWSYASSGALLQHQRDRNLDGKVDYIAHYGLRGLIEWAEADDDFDGRFETRYRFNDGNIQSREVDTDGDGYADLRSDYAHGVLQSTRYMNPKTDLPLRIEHFRLGRLVMAEIDTDHDGVLDKRVTYSSSAEVLRSERIERP